LRPPLFSPPISSFLCQSKFPQSLRPFAHGVGYRSLAREAFFLDRHPQTIKPRITGFVQSLCHGFPLSVRRTSSRNLCLFRRMELLQAARFFSGSRLASFVLAEVMTVSQGSDFVYAGNLQELKAKGRVVVRGRHRPMLLVHGRVSGLDNRKAEFRRTRRQSSGVSLAESPHPLGTSRG
jgi:hypothetical protein